MNKEKVYLNTKMIIESIRKSYKTYNESDKTFYIGYITALLDYKLITIKQTRELKLLVRKENYQGGGVNEI
jgi:hypothetical protein